MSWIDEYLDYTSSQESPAIFHRWCGLVAIAATVNRRVWLDRRSATGVVHFSNFPGQISVCLVAGAGRCKKSTAINMAKPFMKNAGVDIFDGKITPERLLVKLGSKPKPIMTVLASELSAFLGKQSYNDGMIDILNKLLDGESNPYERQTGAPIVLIDPSLTMLMATTPYNMGKAIPPQAHDHGWLSRNIFVYSDKPGSPQSLVANASDIDPNLALDTSRKFNNLIIYLRKLATLSGSFIITRPGQKWYDDYYSAYNTSAISDSEGYAQRRPDHLIRVAMCLALARHPSLTLEEPDFIIADQWLSEIERDMSKALAYIGQHVNTEQTDRILKVFKDEITKTGKPQPIVTSKDLWSRVMRYFGGDQNQFRQQIYGLIDAGVLVNMGKNAAGNIMLIMDKEPY